MGTVVEFKQRCCICGGRMKKFEGNNPAPVKGKGICCHSRNENVVIPARFDRLAKTIRGRTVAVTVCDEVEFWSDEVMR
jgi:hypothetical protein